ncbi:MAG: ABC-F family ATP-binding cassette domain-containing protein [Clostridia bacterium]|nr:ABC-F family ATP-binding cassette domain-containing protein [Clostridia bacterium]
MLVELKNVFFTYTDVPVLKGVSLTLHEEERVGFIGGNGEGKTTLLRILLKELFPDEGEVFVKNGIRIGYLSQTGGLESSSTVYEEMQSVFLYDQELLQKLNEVQLAFERASENELRILSAKAESLQKQISARDSYHFDVRVRTVLNGMGFQNNYDQIVSTMSGGEKTRLKLCKLLLESPDLLILDEPTNHLDVKTLFWLEEYLRTYKGAILVVSHDRYFLDKLTARTIELERGQIFSYKGNYSKYKILKQERVALMQKEYESQQEEIARLQDYVNRNQVRATTAKSAQSRVKQLEKMERFEKPVPPPTRPRFRFTYQDKPYERVLSCEGGSLQVGTKTLLNDASFLLLRGQKCAVTGDNGTGKTTFLKFLLSNDRRVQSGKLTKFAYYDQESANLSPSDRVLDAFWGKHSLLSQTDARSLLAQSGLVAEDMDKTVASLSGGERAKLQLALLQAEHANVLIMDEPTNHLDLPAREALEEALVSFDGTLLFVSHDRYFIQAIATRIAHIEEGAFTFFDGSYEEFLLQQRNLPTPTAKTAERQEKAEKSGFKSKEDRAREAQARNRIKQIERMLESLEAEELALNESMATADYRKMQEICTRLEQIHAESDALYNEYETLI